jgi:hypothetical protein
MNSPHLTADELDEFLAEKSPASITSHVATCAACTALVARDRLLLAALAALPRFPVAAEFSDRVMARVAVASAPVAIAAGAPTARSLAARRRAFGAAFVVGGGIVAGFVWAGAHPAETLRWSGPALQDAGHSLWLSLQAVVANATEQPWFASMRDSLATPARALAAVAGIAGAYAIGLLGLRRLMNEPATHASW